MSASPLRLALPAGVFALVLTPYATLTLPFRRALEAQAGGILVALALLAVAAWRWGGGPARAARPLALALAAYGGAALLGTFVGLARGNGLSFVVGQALSLLLLPAGALVGLALGGAALARPFERAVVAAVAVASSFHLLHWIVMGVSGSPINRLFLPNSVSVGGASLLGALLTAALLLRPEDRLRGRHRGWLVLAAALLAVFIVGSGIRGLWLVLPPALLAAAGLAGWLARLSRRRLTVATATLASLGVLVVVGGYQLARPRPNLLPSESPGHWLLRGEVLDFDPNQEEPHGRVAYAWEANPAEHVLHRWPTPLEPGTFRLQGTVRTDAGSPSEGRALVAVRWLDAQGEALDQIGIYFRASPVAQSREIVRAAPAGATAAELYVVNEAEATGQWWLERTRFERLGPAGAAPWFAQASYFARRLGTLRGFTDEEARDTSMAYRLAESQAALGAVRRAGPSTQWLGHGLGATVTLPPGTVPGVETGEPVNYLHNFYAFLLYKLGVLGTLAVLAALATFLLWPARWALTQAPGPERDRAAVLAAAWLGYCVLSVSSPEILNFRVAPLLGLALAMLSPGSAAREGAAARDRPA